MYEGSFMYESTFESTVVRKYESTKVQLVPSKVLKVLSKVLSYTVTSVRYNVYRPLYFRKYLSCTQLYTYNVVTEVRVQYEGMFYDISALSTCSLGLCCASGSSSERTKIGVKYSTVQYSTRTRTVHEHVQ